MLQKLKVFNLFVIISIDILLALIPKCISLLQRYALWAKKDPCEAVLQRVFCHFALTDK